MADDTLELRKMQESDLEEVAAMEADIFSSPWTREGFRTALSLNDTLYVTALLNGRVAGYCGFYRSFEEGEITNVAVARELRCRGIGDKMLRFLLSTGEEEGVTQYTLEVRKSNAAAIRLYEKLGFTPAGIRKNFYKKPREDAVIMWKR